MKDLFIDYILNRRVARLKGFDYLRVIPVTREVNTSSGGVTEKYGFNHHSTVRMKNINKTDQAFIEYADIADIVKMLNQKNWRQISGFTQGFTVSFRRRINLLIKNLGSLLLKSWCKSCFHSTISFRFIKAEIQGDSILEI